MIASNLVHRAQEQAFILLSLNPIGRSRGTYHVDSDVPSTSSPSCFRSFLLLRPLDLDSLDVVAKPPTFSFSMCSGVSFLARDPIDCILWMGMKRGLLISHRSCLPVFSTPTQNTTFQTLIPSVQRLGMHEQIPKKNFKKKKRKKKEGWGEKADPSTWWLVGRGRGGNHTMFARATCAYAARRAAIQAVRKASTSVRREKLECRRTCPRTRSVGDVGRRRYDVERRTDER